MHRGRSTNSHSARMYTGVHRPTSTTPTAQRQKRESGTWPGCAPATHPAGLETLGLVLICRLVAQGPWGWGALPGPATDPWPALPHPSTAGLVRHCSYHQLQAVTTGPPKQASSLPSVSVWSRLPQRTEDQERAPVLRHNTDHGLLLRQAVTGPQAPHAAPPDTVVCNSSLSLSLHTQVM